MVQECVHQQYHCFYLCLKDLVMKEQGINIPSLFCDTIPISPHRTLHHTTPFSGACHVSSSLDHWEHHKPGMIIWADKTCVWRTTSALWKTCNTSKRAYIYKYTYIHIHIYWIYTVYIYILTFICRVYLGWFLGPNTRRTSKCWTRPPKQHFPPFKQSSITQRFVFDVVQHVVTVMLGWLGYILLWIPGTRDS